LFKTPSPGQSYLGGTVRRFGHGYGTAPTVCGRIVCARPLADRHPVVLLEFNSNRIFVNDDRSCVNLDVYLFGNTSEQMDSQGCLSLTVTAPLPKSKCTGTLNRKSRTKKICMLMSSIESRDLWLHHHCSVHQSSKEEDTLVIQSFDQPTSRSQRIPQLGREKAPHA
jgi:hypothetical protein